MATYYYAVIKSPDSTFPIAREHKPDLDSVLVELPKLVSQSEVIHQHERDVPIHVSFSRFELILKNGVREAVKEGLATGTFDADHLEKYLDDALHFRR